VFSRLNPGRSCAQNVINTKEFLQEKHKKDLETKNSFYAIYTKRLQNIFLHVHGIVSVISKNKQGMHALP
jgi:hypothetical protein